MEELELSAKRIRELAASGDEVFIAPGALTPPHGRPDYASRDHATKLGELLVDTGFYIEAMRKEADK